MVVLGLSDRPLWRSSTAGPHHSYSARPAAPLSSSTCGAVALRRGACSLTAPAARSTSSQEFYPQLCAFAAAHGTARVPATGATNELARWAQDQRVRRKQRKLAADKAALLEQLPGWEWLQ